MVKCEECGLDHNRKGGEGDKIALEIYCALQTFKDRELASHRDGDEYGAVLWTLRCLVNPENNHWLKAIIQEVEREGAQKLALGG